MDLEFWQLTKESTKVSLRIIICMEMGSSYLKTVISFKGIFRII